MEFNKPKKNIRLGLIGVGKWGANYIKTIEDTDFAELKMIACKSLSKKRFLSDNYLLTDNWKDVTNSKEVDGIIVATPPKMHYEIAKSSIKSKKPVIIEKPVTLNSKDAKSLLSLALKNKVNVRVNHIYLYHPIYRALKKFIIHRNDLKSVFSEAGNFGPFRTDITPLWDWAPHDIAMCLDLLGEMPSKVNAKYTKKIFEKGFNKSNVKITLEFKNIISEINIGNLMEYKKRFLKLNYQYESYIFDPITYDLPQEEKNKCIQEINKNYFDRYKFNDKPLNILLNNFIYDLLNDRFDVSDLKLAVKVVIIIELVEKILSKKFEV